MPKRDSRPDWTVGASTSIPLKTAGNTAASHNRFPKALYADAITTPAALEDRGDSVIAQFVHSDSKLETHTFRVLPKKAFSSCWAQAILTLSIKHEAGDSEFVRNVVQQTWEIARRTTFHYDTKA